MEDEHRAYHLSAGLVMGGSCPVCRQDVSEPPELDAPEEMEKVGTELLTARQGRDRAVKKLKGARAAVDRQEQSLKDSDSRVKDLERELEEAPTREVVEAALEQVKAAVGALQKANGKEKEASDRLAETQKVANALEGDEKRAWQNYDTQRDLLAEMQPPAAERENLAVAWDSLAGWAKKQWKGSAPSMRKQEERKTVESALNDLRESIAEWCSARGGGRRAADGVQPRAGPAGSGGEADRTGPGRPEPEALRQTSPQRHLARHLGARNSSGG